ncbi:MAG: excalibur calcium-binding domain-containing protein [Aeromicrobium sp.]
MIRTIAALAAGLSLTVGVVATASSAEAVPAKKYQNCTKLNKVYPHGVGKPGARDKTSGTPVTNFKADKKVYALNTGSDRDKDGIACEKK